MKVKDGNLLDADEKYIAHQCNCVSLFSKGLAKQIFDKYPCADTYTSKKRGERLLGNISIHKIDDNRVIINMYSQFYPGKPKHYRDAAKLRVGYFTSCLNYICSFLENRCIKKIAMPYMIGCGLAGGNWDDYHRLLINFEKSFGIEIVLYKLGEK